MKKVKLMLELMKTKLKQNKTTKNSYDEIKLKYNVKSKSVQQMKAVKSLEVGTANRVIFLFFRFHYL